MKITVGKWGAGGSIMGLVVHIYLGDTYIRIPFVGEMAWNCTGFHVNRIQRGSRVAKEFRED